MMTLVYVDEQESARNDMIRTVYLSEYFDAGDVKVLDPSTNIDETIEQIEALHPDALITDYVLSEHKAGVGYTGSDLVLKFQERHKDFPCFVTTGYATDAATQAP